LRPLVRSSNSGNTSILSRDHTIVVATSGLVTITGGKWTTYRKMAKDAVDNAAFVGKLPVMPCVTDHLKIHGWTDAVDNNDPLHIYGSDVAGIRSLMAEDPSLTELLHPDFHFTKAEVVWACRHEMAMTVEDVLARRLRLLFLDARAAIEVAPVVAEILANEGNKLICLDEFLKTAKGYLP
jgi:glycerol-3-phosphate dehydrogenase